MDGGFEPEPVKYFVAVLWQEAHVLREACLRMQALWGAIDFEGPDHPFDLTNYYEAEMGTGLKRRLLSFAPLHGPVELAPAKRACIAIEAELAGSAGRRVNLDIGYLDHNKLVLASVKPAGQKIYLALGVYADFVARFGDGRYQPFPWTFPDFKDGRYDEELCVSREVYLREINAWRKAKGLSNKETSPPK